MTVQQTPATPAQRRMWFLDQMMPGIAAYNVPWTVRISGPLDVARLREALSAVVARHEAWRTVFAESGGQPVQIVRPATPVPCPVSSMSETQAHERAGQLARAAFDLAAGPLMRAELIQVAPQEHLLVLVFHHIIIDGWSVDLFLREMRDAYAGEPATPAALQYPAYARWAAERTADPAAETYWREALSGVDSLVELPADRPRPDQPSFLGGRIDFPIGYGDRARAYARERGLTPYVVLLSGFAATVAKFAGRDDFVVGAPVAGRVHPGTENLAGLMVNTMPLRMRIEPGTTFDALTAAVRDQLVPAMSHQDVPFERIADLTQASRGLSWSPLVQLMFQWERLPAAADQAGLHWQAALLENGGAKLDLTLSVFEDDHGLNGRIVYAADIFDAATVQAFARSWLALLDAALSRPELAVLSHPLATPEQVDQVTAWGTGPTLDTVGQTAAEMLEYAWPGDEPARIAAALRALGAGPESRIGLQMPRGDRLIPALLGVWWAGAAYVPLDPAYPQARREAMVADAGVRVVLGEGNYPGVRSVDIEEALTHVPIPRAEVHAEQAAYTIFTSGSTGRPKGVTVTQGNVAAMLQAFTRLLRLDSSDHLVAVTTIAFDISVLELLLPLACGARVTVADADTVADPQALRQLLLDTAATALQATPAAWRGLLLSGGVPESVRTRLCGGEAMPQDLAGALAEPGVRLWNVYGPTETTVWSTACELGPDETVHIGAPIPGTRVHVLDSAMNPLPPGVAGEVYLGGAGVTRGYHGRAGLTAQRFLPSPFHPGERLYATGDLGRWRAGVAGGSAQLHLLGRNDHQVKIRGYRIELGEIETALRALPGVADAVVSVVRRQDDPRLAAYIVGETAGLREKLAVTLPDYMVPAAFVSLPELPRTLNGKIDRNQLPEPQWVSAPSRAPQTPAEHELTKLWQELLALPMPPGADDNFFVLGGHSLTATRLLARMRAEMAVAVPLLAFFRLPTVAGLAAEVDRIRAGGAAATPQLSSSTHELDDDALDALLQELMR